MATKSKFADINEQIADFQKRCKLDSWTAFVKPLEVPAELVPAIAANRPSLVQLATRRAMDEAEVDVMFKLIEGLLETNQALREHSQEMAKLLDNFGNAFKAVDTIGRKLIALGSFEQFDIDEAA